MFSKKPTLSNAYPCMTDQGCPQEKRRPGAPGYCPAWVSSTIVAEENHQTGEKRAVTGCFYDVVLRMMEFTVIGAERPANEIVGIREELRKEIQGTSAALAQAIIREMRTLAENRASLPADLPDLTRVSGPNGTGG